MKYEEGKRIGETILMQLKPYIERGEIAGSIRRKKPEVHDVDLVVIPKQEFMVMQNIKKVLRQYGRFDKQGSDILIVKDPSRFVQVDCYIATEQTYEMVLLIRTGSASHNIKLAQKAIEKGLSLKHGLGLVDKETGKVIANTEKDIFEALGLEFKEPEDRD